MLVKKNTTTTNVSNHLLFSLLPYDEVSAFLLLVKARNSSLLTGRLICLSWIVYFCGSVNYIVMFTWLVHRRNATGGRRVFCFCFWKTRLQVNLFMPLWTNLLHSLKVLFYRLLNNINNFRIWVLGPRPMTLENVRATFRSHRAFGGRSGKTDFRHILHIKGYW